MSQHNAATKSFEPFGGTSRYEGKLDSLRDLFGDPALTVTKNAIQTGGREYPIVDDVIVLLDHSQLPSHIANRIPSASSHSRPGLNGYERDPNVQFSFGEEWKRFPAIIPEHEVEFAQYMDLVDTSSLRNHRVVDLGCGIGRWSFFLKDRCREIVLVDFSEAIFVAKRNLASADNALFFMGDIMNLPFRDNCADLSVCLGVLHHLPVKVLDAVRRISRVSSDALVYLYYAMDNRPGWYRLVWYASDIVRRFTSRVKSLFFREVLCWALTIIGYLPFVLLGKLLAPLGLSRHIPNFEAHRNDSVYRIRQDCYDRFFTSIEQRVSLADIEELRDTFENITVSPHQPFWHFLCRRKA